MREGVKVAYIMRGIPGSGKSTLARKLAGEHGAIHSTDDFFTVDEKYRFKPKKLEEYHDKNLRAFERSLASGVGVVICDNTNIKLGHYEPYKKAAENAYYRVVIVTMSHPEVGVAAERNIHGVPKDTITRMIENWEN